MKFGEPLKAWSRSSILRFATLLGLWEMGKSVEVQRLATRRAMPKLEESEVPGISCASQPKTR